MLKALIIVAAASLPIFLAAGELRAEEFAVSRFGVEGLAGWENKVFKGQTDYRLVQEGGRTLIKAHSRGTASGLFKKVALDPTRFRYLAWSWKIVATVKN